MPESPGTAPRARLRAETLRLRRASRNLPGRPTFPRSRREERLSEKASSPSASAGGQPSRCDAGEVDEDARPPIPTLLSADRAVLPRARAGSSRLRQRLVRVRGQRPRVAEAALDRALPASRRRRALRRRARSPCPARQTRHRRSRASVSMRQRRGAGRRRRRRRVHLALLDRQAAAREEPLTPCLHRLAQKGLRAGVILAAASWCEANPSR